MKTTLLFLTALAAIPAYAGNINFDDWALDTELGLGANYAVDEDGGEGQKPQPDRYAGQYVHQGGPVLLHRPGGGLRIKGADGQRCQRQAQEAEELGFAAQCPP